MKSATRWASLLVLLLCVVVSAGCTRALTDGFSMGLTDGLSDGISALVNNWVTSLGGGA